MRPIKFRGKCLHKSAWAEGDLLHGVGVKYGRVFILPVTANLPNDCDPYDGYEVDPDTVCQFTELRDSKGIEIYEGDIFTVNGKYPKVIEFRQDHSSFCMANISDLDKVYLYPWQQIRPDWWEDYSREIVVIGNKFDNPELMQE